MVWNDDTRIDVGREDGRKYILNTKKMANLLQMLTNHLSKKDFIDLQEALIDSISEVKYPKKKLKKVVKVKPRKTTIKVPKKKVKKKSKKVLVKR